MCEKVTYNVMYLENLRELGTCVHKGPLNIVIYSGRRKPLDGGSWGLQETSRLIPDYTFPPGRR